MKLAELVKLYLADRGGVVSAAVARKYRFYLAGFCRDHGDLDLSDLRPSHVRAWVQSHPTWKSTSSQRDAIKMMLVLCNWAVVDGIIAASPLFRLGKELRLIPEARRDFLISPEHEATFLSHASYPLASIFRAMLWTGRRPGEMRKARKSELHDAGDGRLILRLREHKNLRRTGLPEDVHLPDEMRVLVRNLVADPLNGSDWLFVTQSRCPWTDANLARCVKRTVARAGLPKAMIPYSCRHTWITRRLLAGVPITLVARMAGTSPMVIQKHYEHVEKGSADVFEAAAAAGMAGPEANGMKPIRYSPKLELLAPIPPRPVRRPAGVVHEPVEFHGDRWQFTDVGFVYGGVGYAMEGLRLRLLRAIVEAGEPTDLATLSDRMGERMSRHNLFHLRNRLRELFHFYGPDGKRWNPIPAVGARGMYTVNFPPPASDRGDGG